MNEIYVATSNKGKLGEIQAILDIPLKAVELEIDEIQSMDLEEIAYKKAQAAFEKIGKPVIVDDAGLFVEAWNGFPGPFVKHMTDAIGYDGFLKLMSKEKNKKVKIAVVIGYHDGKKVHTFHGEYTGSVLDKKRGNNGFGFDPLVIPDGQTKTFAQMDPAEKNKISHRGIALSKFKEFLDSQEK